MKSYVTDSYDFFQAITVDKNLDSIKWKEFNISAITHVTDDSAIVRTSHGAYFCESMSDGYMRVSTFIETVV